MTKRNAAPPVDESRREVAADPLRRLLDLRARREHLVVGLMSGTSADGVDAALVKLVDRPSSVQRENAIDARVLSFRTLSYSRAIADEVLRSANASAREVAALDHVLGRLFAQAALEVVRDAELDIQAVDLIGSHGQTVCHSPPSPGRAGTTLQIGNAAVIATETGLPVVSDFRARDMALGGQGAPLVPMVDHLLFSRRGENRILLNIGGLANLTATNGVLDDVLAFDTGPGNALLDSLMRLLTNGQSRFDRGGETALRGTPKQELLRDLLAHPFLLVAPPKSADRDTFGEPLARRLMAENADLAPEDLLATAAAFTSDSILRSLESLPQAYRRIDRLIVSGGGVYNEAVMRRIREGLPRVVIETSAEHGVHPDAKEALAFAVLARETLLGRPSNLPGVTGASSRAVLGAITLGTLS